MIVRNQAEFVASLKTGATIQLAAGSYQWPEATRVSGVKVSSLDRRYPAILTGSTFVRQCQFITFEAVTFADSRPRPNSVNLLRLLDCANINVRYCNFTGGDRSVYMVRVKGFAFDGNNLTDIGEDGFFIGECSSGAFRRNWLRNWHWSKPEHPDAFQMFTNNSLPPHNVGPCYDLEFYGNLIECSPTMRAQGVFVRDEGRRIHNRIRVRNNLIISTMWNGIFSELATNVLITGNMLMFEINPAEVNLPDNQVTKRAHIVVNGGSVTMSGNVAGAFLGATGAGNVVKKSFTRAEIEDEISRWKAINRP